MTTPLHSALLKRDREYSAAIDRLRSHVENDPEAYDAAVLLREAVTLVGCLRRLVLECNDVREIHRAFGAPGDFGYETPIGDALSRLYREARASVAIADERARTTEDLVAAVGRMKRADLCVLRDAVATRIYESDKQCTGITARWCPVHGVCSCPDDSMDSDSCELHSVKSTHGDNPEVSL